MFYYQNKVCIFVEQKETKKNYERFRYNSEKEDRKFNTCGMEKNPNNLSFTLKHGLRSNYRYVREMKMEISFMNARETVEIENVNLFDIGFKPFKTLNHITSLY